MLADKENVCNVVKETATPTKLRATNLEAELETANIRNEVLREKNSDLSKELASRTDECSSLKREIEQKVEELQQLKQNTESEVATAKNEAAEAGDSALEAARLAAVEETQQNYENKISDLKVRLQQCEEECAVLRSQVESSDEEKSKAIAGFQAQLIRTQEDAAQKEEQWRTQLEEEKRAVAALQEDMRLVYRKNKKELQALEEKYQHENYKQRYLSGMSAVKNAAEETKCMQELMLEVEEASAMQDKLQATLAEATTVAQDRLQKLIATRERLAPQLDAQKQQHAEANAVQEAKGEVERLGEELSQISAELELERSDGVQLREEMARLQEEREETNEMVQVEKEALEESVVECRAAMEKLKLQNAQLEQKLEQQSEQKQDEAAAVFQVQQVQALQAKLDEAEEEKLHVKQEKSQAEEQRLSAEKQSVQMQAQAEAAKAEAEAAKAEAEAAKAEAEAAKAEAEAAKAEAEAAKAEAEAAKAEAEAAKAEAEAAKAKAGAAKAEAEKAKAEAEKAPAAAQPGAAAASTSTPAGSDEVVRRLQLELEQTKAYLKQYSTRAAERMGTLKEDLKEAESDLELHEKLVLALYDPYARWKGFGSQEAHTLFEQVKVRGEASEFEEPESAARPLA